METSLELHFLHGRMSEARLHTVLPSLCNGRGGVAEAEGAGAGWMAPPSMDPLQDIEEKYAVVRRKLLTEMLQEHYGSGDVHVCPAGGALGSNRRRSVFGFRIVLLLYLHALSSVQCSLRVMCLVVYISHF